MNISDLNALTNIPLLEDSVNTATVTGAVVDLSQYLGVLKVTQHVGPVSGTTPSLNGYIQDSADGTTFAAVTGLTFAAVTATGNEQSIQVDTRGVRRYIQYVGTIAGTTPSVACSVDAVGFKKTV